MGKEKTGEGVQGVVHTRPLCWESPDHDAEVQKSNIRLHGGWWASTGVHVEGRLKVENKINRGVEPGESLCTALWSKSKTPGEYSQLFYVREKSYNMERRKARDDSYELNNN